MNARALDEVDFISGKTALYGIVGDPIQQVRSPEMITAELQTRGRDAILVPVHIRAHDFETVLPQLLKVENLRGLVFTIPFKVRACVYAEQLGPQATVVGAINALGRDAQGRGYR